MLKELPPHLVSSGDTKHCSVCKQEFKPDAQPSLSKAFAQHIREKHAKPEVAAKAAAQ